MKFNKEIHNGIGIDPQLITADADGTTVKGPAVDGLGFEEALITLQHGAVVAGATLAVKMQESPTTTDGDFVDIAGAAFANVVGGSGVVSGIFVGRLNRASRKRYLRLVATVTGDTKTAQVSGLIALGAAKVKPVSQVTALAFNL